MPGCFKTMQPIRYGNIFFAKLSFHKIIIAFRYAVHYAAGKHLQRNVSQAKNHSLECFSKLKERFNKWAMETLDEQKHQAGSEKKKANSSWKSG